MFASGLQPPLPCLLHLQNSEQTVPKIGAIRLTFGFALAPNSQSGLGSKIGTTCRCLLRLNVHDGERQFWQNPTCCALKTVSGALSRNYASEPAHSSTNSIPGLSYYVAEWSD